MILHSRRCSGCVWTDQKFYMEWTKMGILLDEAPVTLLPADVSVLV